MGYALSKERELSRSAVQDVLQRLWQTKLNSIAFLEKWLAETKDVDLSAGLASQLKDDRRHAHLIGEQIRRFGGRFNPATYKDDLSRVFIDANTADADLTRLFALHRGIKAFTVERCGHLIPAVDSVLAQTLDRIARDDERHMRWADVRLTRMLTHARMRECNILLGRVRRGLESVWERTWTGHALGFGFRRHG